MKPWAGKGNRRRVLWAGLAVLLVLLGWRVLLGGKGKDAEMGEPLPPVRVAAAVAQSVPHMLNGIGSVMPSRDVLVRSRVDGQLVQLHFQEGQHVQAGQLLAEIDPRPFEAALAEAQGRLHRDKAQLDNARRDLNRYAKLAKSDFIAAQQYETQRALVRQYAGTVQADEAAVASARLQLEYSRITAPVGGRLGLRQVDVGNQIKSSDSKGIVRITEVSPCDVLFTLPESQLPLVAQAVRQRELQRDLPPLPVQAWDSRHQVLLAEGELLSLDNQIDRDTGTVKLKARFPNTDMRLYANQFVNAALRVRILENAVTIPASAVQLGSKGAYVYVLAKNDKGQDVVRLRLIRPGMGNDAVAVAEEGLKVGERVVVDGLDRLRDGIQVKVAASTETPRLDAYGQVKPAEAAEPQPAARPVRAEKSPVSGSTDGTEPRP